MKFILYDSIHKKIQTEKLRLNFRQLRNSFYQDKLPIDNLKSYGGRVGRGEGKRIWNHCKIIKENQKPEVNMPSVKRKQLWVSFLFLCLSNWEVQGNTINIYRKAQFVDKKSNLKKKMQAYQICWKVKRNTHKRNSWKILCINAVHISELHIWERLHTI